MRRFELSAVFRAVQEMTWSQRRELMQRLKAVQAAEETQAIVEERMQALRVCPHCQSTHVVRNGLARGLQRYKCGDCSRTFNALTKTPLARLRYRERWLSQTQALIDGLSITKAAQQLEVARSTAFRWRHRFLALPHHVKASHFSGIVEADETCVLKSHKGQRRQRSEQGRKARSRGGRAHSGACLSSTTSSWSCATVRAPAPIRSSRRWTPRTWRRCCSPCWRLMPCCAPTVRPRWQSG